MFTVSFIDNDFGDFMEAKGFLRDNLPRGIDIEAVFDYESAIERLDFFEAMEARPSVGVYVVEASLEGGRMSDLIVRIKKSKWFDSVPIIIYTNTVDQNATRECLAAGANKLISKDKNGLNELCSYITKLFPRSSS